MKRGRLLARGAQTASALCALGVGIAACRALLWWQSGLALLTAIQKRDVRVVRSLLDKGADPNFQEVPLQERNTLSFLQRAFSVSPSQKAHDSALLIALRPVGGALQSSVALYRNVSPNFSSLQRSSPIYRLSFHKSARANEASFCRRVTRNAANLLRFPRGRLLITMAGDQERLQIHSAQLIALSLQMEYREDPQAVAIIRALMEHGADPQATNAAGDSAVSVARHQGWTSAARLLHQSSPVP